MKLTSSCLFFLTFILFTSQILGHGWVYSPQPRGFTLNDQVSASQTGPCGKTNPPYPQTTNVEINGSLLVSFKMGNDHDSTTTPGTCTFSLSTQDVNNGIFDNNVFKTITPCNGGDYTNNVSVIVDRPGTYYLQWKWTAGDGGDWYNCIRLFIEDPSIQMQQVPHGQVETETLTNENVRNLYYAITNLPSADPNVETTINNQHLLLDTSVSASSIYYVNFTYSNSFPPLTYNSVPANDNLKVDAVTPKMVSLCNVITKTVNEVYVTIFPYQNLTYGNFTGDVTFSSTLYDAKVEFLNSAGVNVNLKKGSIAYFWTAASSTQTSSKRMIVEGTGGNYYISGPYRQCNSNQYVRGESHCRDLGTDIEYPTKQYMAVEFLDSDFTGKVRVEKGTCETYSDMSKILVSIVLLFVVLLF